MRRERGCGSHRLRSTLTIALGVWVRSLFAMVLLVLALAFAGAALAGDTHADWKASPDQDQLQRFYPDRAQRENVGGSVRVECGLSREAVLHDCQVLSESPPGMGFGEAALKTTQLFQMAPATHDGQPIESSVIIPIKFALPAPVPVDMSQVTADMIGLGLSLIVLLVMAFQLRDMAQTIGFGSIRTVMGADHSRTGQPVRFWFWATAWVLAAAAFSLVFMLLALRQLLDLYRVMLA